MVAAMVAEMIPGGMALEDVPVGVFQFEGFGIERIGDSAAADAQDLGDVSAACELEGVVV